MKIAVFDVGGTYIKYACSDEQGNLSHKGKIKTPQSREAFYDVVEEIINKLGTVEGLAFSLPGFIDAKQGYISVGGSLRYHDDCHFVKDMEAHMKLPVSIQNDAKCAALAQIWKGNQTNENAVVLVFGTGVGGALIQQGQLYDGSHFMAMELSCIIQGDIATQGLQATLGNRFSIPNLMNRIAEKLHLEHIEGEKAFQLLREGNEVVKAEMLAYSRTLALQLFNFQCCFDPDIFYIGGGISAQPAFISLIQQAVDGLLEKIPFALPPIQVKQMCHQADANLIGAVYQYLRNHEA